jgi:hypothetical protein
VLRVRPTLKLWLFGAAFGLLFGLSYWYAWGCRNCAKDKSPIALVAFCTVVGAGMGRVWGKDHLRQPPV